ncbi:Box C/D snoRNA accumulation, partial [Scheffersomyces stipitis CBS 6054]
METEQALCAVCHINNFKYTCPACGIRTCCIVCVKRHKKQNECTGVVDKTKFVGRKELVESASHLNRDYNFLLNVERQIQLGKGDIKSSAKNMFKRNFNSGNSINSGNNRKSTSEDDARLATIKEVYPNDPAVVVKRQNTLVIQVPSGMTRATTNKSGYDKKSGSFIWTVEWILLGSKGEVVSQFLSYKLKEHLILGDAVPMNILNNSKSEKTKTINNEEKHKGEQQYNKIDIDKSQLNLYIDNVLSSDKSQRSVLVLDKQMTIAEALKDKVVLEYPTFFITTSEKVIENAVVSIEEAYKIKKNVEESESGSHESDSDSSSNSSESSDSDSSSESSDEDDGPEEESSRP